MKLESYNPGIIKTAFDCIGHIVDEIKLEFNHEGLKLNALDKAHITFVSLVLDKEYFDEYDCSEPVEVIIDANQFMTILKRCKNNDILKLSISEGNINLIFEGDASRKYNLRLIDSEYQSPKPPMMEYDCNISVPSTLMKDSLEDLILFGETINFLVDENYLKLSSEGSFGDSIIEYLHGENILTTRESMFSIDKLKEIFRATKFSEVCTLGIGDQMPLTVTFELVTGDGNMSFLLAPKLPAED